MQAHHIHFATNVSIAQPFKESPDEVRAEVSEEAPAQAEAEVAMDPAEVQAVDEILLPEGKERPQVRRLRYTHDAMIDLIIADPGIHQNTLAAHFGYTASWISTVMHSDAFQAKLALRRGELIDPTIRLMTEERFRAVTNRSLEVLQEKLSRPADSIPDNLVLRAVELGAKALGIGGNAPPPSIPTDHLAGLADRLIQLQSGVRKGVVYEQLENVEVVEARVIPSGNEGRSSGREGPGSPRPDSRESHPNAQVHGGGEVLVPRDAVRKEGNPNPSFTVNEPMQPASQR